MKLFFKPPVYKKILAIVLLSTALYSHAQDIHFSQFFEAPLLRNPSLAGIFSGDVRVQAVYRDQWNSVTTAYKTASLNGEYKLPAGRSDDFVTLGLQMLYDRAGSVSWVSAHLLPALNYHKSLSTERSSYLSIGFMGGPVQRRLDVTKMTTNSQYDGQGLGENIPAAQYTYFDGSVGMSYNTQLNEDANNNMFIGLGYHHLTKPKNSFYRNSNIELQPKWVGSAGLKFSVTPESYLTIQSDYSLQGKYQEVVAGALYGINLNQEIDKPQYTIHGGAFIRWNDAFIPVIKMDYRPFSFALSYDINISKLKASSYGRGGFELSISYVGFLDRENSTINSTLCPRF